MKKADLIGELAWHSFAAGALCGLLALGALLPTVIPDGAYALCLEVESYTITLHVDPAACPPPAEEAP